MRGSAATPGRRGRAAVDTLRDRLRGAALPPLLALVLAGAGGYVGPAQPMQDSPVSVVAPSAAGGPLVPASSIVLAAPERALEALRIVAVGAQPTADGAVLYAAYLAAVEGAPAGCHLSASVLAALGQAEPGPLGDTERPRDLAAAVAATAGSLCAHGRDLARPADLRTALLARTGSPLVVRLVLTLKARYDVMGLGLVGAPGPVLVPLLLEQATALVADPYGPAVVHPSRVRRGTDGGEPSGSSADVREANVPPAAPAISDPQAQAPSGSAANAASVPVMPTDLPTEDEGPSALPESASPDVTPGSVSPSAVDEPTGSGDASGGPDPSVAAQDPGTDVVEPVCPTGVVVEAPDAGTPSSPPPPEDAGSADPADATGAAPCATEPAPDAGTVTAEPDASVDPSATTTPEATPEAAPTLP